MSYDNKCTWASLDSALKEHVILKIVGTLECLVCSELMHVPFLASCGHSFCYGCLNLWFESKVNCPTCRTDMETQPVLNIVLRDVSKTISDVILDTLQDEARQLLLEARSERILEYEDDMRHGRLFGEAFKSAPTLVDTSDGVPRCGNCHWEAHGSVCLHCGSRFRVPRLDLYYDLEDGDAYDEDGDEVELFGVAQDAYDSNDSFVDDREIEEGEGLDMELGLELGLGRASLGLEDNAERHLNGSVASAQELWQGFESHGPPHRSPRAWFEDSREGSLESLPGFFGVDMESAMDELHNRHVLTYIDGHADESDDSGESVEEINPRRRYHIVDLDSE